MVNLPSGRATHHDCKHEYPRLAEPYETTKSNPVWSSTTSEIVDPNSYTTSLAFAAAEVDGVAQPASASVDWSRM
jgi:hypothetical protein